MTEKGLLKIVVGAYGIAGAALAVATTCLMLHPHIA
jgi:hypothetical protein